MVRFPHESLREERLSYNDAVEEALCFGWIDSTIKNIIKMHRAQVLPLLEAPYEISGFASPTSIPSENVPQNLKSA